MDQGSVLESEKCLIVLHLGSLELIPDLYRHLLGATVIEIWDQML